MLLSHGLLKEKISAFVRSESLHFVVVFGEKL